MNNSPAQKIESIKAKLQQTRQLSVQAARNGDVKLMGQLTIKAASLNRSLSQLLGQT
jgi:hypothetical protein